jgi:hypothetical protein
MATVKENSVAAGDIMSRIETIKYEPCSNCNFTCKVDLGEECWGAELVRYLLSDVPDSWDDFRNRDIWNKMLDKLAEKYDEGEWFPGEFWLDESAYYCPDCEKLKIKADWFLGTNEGECWNLDHRCECGALLKKVENYEELNNITIRCPICDEPLKTIIITLETEDGKEKETYCYPCQGN